MDTFHFNHNSLTLITGGSDSFVRLWDLRYVAEKITKLSSTSSNFMESSILKLPKSIDRKYIPESKYYRLCAMLNVQPSWQRGMFLGQDNSYSSSSSTIGKSKTFIVEIACEDGTISLLSKPELYRPEKNLSAKSRFTVGQVIEYFAPKFSEFVERE